MHWSGRCWRVDISRPLPLTTLMASLHIVAVWFCFDGKDIYVATSSRSRKARNLKANPQVAVMIDACDPAASYGVTVMGTAQVLTGESSRKCNTEVHKKYLGPIALADSKVGPVLLLGMTLRSGSRLRR
jgi:uncharacterized protein YhbP (UPF0306 family)